MSVGVGLTRGGLVGRGVGSGRGVRVGRGVGVSGGAVVVELKDVDLLALARAMALFGVELPEIVAVAVQDHGYRPGSGNNAVRFEHLQRLLDHGGDFSQMVYREPPADMLRMQAVAQSVPGAVLMDTGTAAVLGSLGDPRVAAAVAGRAVTLTQRTRPVSGGGIRPVFSGARLQRRPP
jgi:uncharacterized protein (DUF1786 family)